MSATLTSGTYYRNDIVAGDFNGDGFDDVAVAGWGDPGGEVNVHYGSAAGISSSSGTNWTNTTRRFYAYMVGAGDFYGDGYTDLAVGAMADHEVHYGSPSGLSAAANVTFSLLPINRPYSMWGGGDYNGDGFDDLAIGMTASDQAMVIKGSALGLRTGGRPLLLSGNSGTLYGNMISSGDVNGDGRDDLLVGARDESKAYLHLGNPGFLTATPATTFPGASYSYMGLLLGVLGDTDGDGYDEVGLGEYASADAGHGYVYAGNASGSLTSRQTVTGAAAGMDPACTNEQMMGAYTVGDINGDGYADLGTAGMTMSACTGGGSGSINRVILWWGTP